MSGQIQPAPVSAIELAGDFALLAEQLGSPDRGQLTDVVAALLQPPRVTDAPSLGRFLEAYRDQVLVPLELPAIHRAWQHASRFETRELIAFDQQLAAEARLRPFALASLHAGRNQMRRFRPLRDHKLVQRYLGAIEAGEASGWHTLVYGIALSIYSLPPRQGLLAYSAKTLDALARRAGRGLDLADAELASIAEAAGAGIPNAVNALVDAGLNPFPGANASPAMAR